MGKELGFGEMGEGLKKWLKRGGRSKCGGSEKMWEEVWKNVLEC